PRRDRGRRARRRPLRSRHRGACGRHRRRSRRPADVVGARARPARAERAGASRDRVRGRAARLGQRGADGAHRAHRERGDHRRGARRRRLPGGARSAWRRRIQRAGRNGLPRAVQRAAPRALRSPFMTLWSGRFDTAPDPAAFDFGISFGFDRALFEDDVTGSIAWADALGAAGVLSDEDRALIVSALEAILEEGRRNPAWISGPDEDVHSFVERQLISTVGDAGRRLHTGRSRNEQVSLDLRLYLRRRIPLLQRAVAGVIDAIAAQAASAGDALMPSFTHFRPAQPVLVAHFFLSHAAPLRRDFARLEGARAECDALPLGSGAIAGTAYAVDVAALARDLGFSRVVDNSMDASSDRDFAATFLYAAALTMVHLSRLAEDLIIFCGDEHRFFELSDALSTGSSMMPQKKNPDPLELARGKTGRVIGLLVALLTTIKGLPTG